MHQIQEMWRSQFESGGAVQGKRGGYLVSWVTQHTTDKLNWIHRVEASKNKSKAFRSYLFKKRRKKCLPDMQEVLWESWKRQAPFEEISVRLRAGGNHRGK